MAKDNLNIIVYRLNKVSFDDLWIEQRNKIESDKDILKIIENAGNERFDKASITKTGEYKWSIRPVKTFFKNEMPELSILIFAKSTLSHEAETIIDRGIIDTITESYPPPAETMRIIIHWKRHMILVENRSSMTTGETWLRHFMSIIESSAIDLDYDKKIELEEISPDKELIKTFLSYDYIRRLRVNLRIPNPDLNRFTRKLKEKLEEDNINEILQDMKSDSGLSQEDSGSPFAAVALASDGYKKGPVLIEGIKDGKIDSFESSSNTVKGKLLGMKSFIKGIKSTATTKEGQRIISAIEQELDRICPQEN